MEVNNEIKVRNLLIYNIPNIHYEIIESVLHHHRRIIKINDKLERIKVYIDVNKRNRGYINYMRKKYPDVKINENHQNVSFSWGINCTIYPDMKSHLKNDDKHFYISHRVHRDLIAMPNVYFLTPICKIDRYFIPSVLPKIERVKTEIPIYCIQGNMSRRRRNYHILTSILKNNFKYDYRIKLVGKGDLPKGLEPYSDKLIVKNNLSFVDFHNEFADVYCIMPLIIRKTHYDYYYRKLTSSISYGVGYKLKFFIDKNLNDIYNLDDCDTYIFNDLTDVVDAFEKSLEDFYKSHE